MTVQFDLYWLRRSEALATVYMLLYVIGAVLAFLVLISDVVDREARRKRVFTAMLSSSSRARVVPDLCACCVRWCSVRAGCPPPRVGFIDAGLEDRRSLRHPPPNRLVQRAQPLETWQLHIHGSGTGMGEEKAAVEQILVERSASDSRPSD